jgi:hypothetical protein
MTRAAAKTGTDNTTRMAVSVIDQTNSGIWLSCIPAARIPTTVARMLTEPRMELKPFKCRLRIARSTLAPECRTLSGGYAVQPVPAPCSTRVESSRRASAGGLSQKLMLFRRGKAMSGAPIIIGTSQLPNPPNNAGMTMNKSIKRPWPVMMTLYYGRAARRYPTPKLQPMSMLRVVPTSPEKRAKIR